MKADLGNEADERGQEGFCRWVSYVSASTLPPSSYAGYEKPPL